MKFILTATTYGDSRTLEIKDFGTNDEYVSLMVSNREGEPLLGKDNPLVIAKKDLQRMAKGL